MSRGTELEVADYLDALIPELERLVSDLVEGKPQPYARVYHFRWKVGQAVAKLGSGNPGRVRDP